LLRGKKNFSLHTIDREELSLWLLNKNTILIHQLSSSSGAVMDHLVIVPSLLSLCHPLLVIVSSSLSSSHLRSCGIVSSCRHVIVLSSSSSCCHLIIVTLPLSSCHLLVVFLSSSSLPCCNDQCHRRHRCLMMDSSLWCHSLIIVLSSSL
jgi:uncharacterized membrane protein